jgi:alcohol dehydrogenase (cytochrome c)
MIRLPFLLAMLTSVAAYGQVPFERIVNAGHEPQNWLTYSGNYAGHRYSELSEIDRKSVASLKVAWAVQMPSSRTETTPIAIDGILYITAPNMVSAIDGKTGRSLWTWTRPLPPKFRMNGFVAVNRGAAVLDDTLYVGALDGVLIALDLKSGSERWRAPVADWHAGFAITSAPIAAAGKVVIGVSGGEAGVRGFLDAYDAKTGKRAWRFYTVPAPGEPGNETWANDSWKTGGGTTWTPGSFDPETGILFWGVGNPGPDWNGDGRKGDNLYTCSLLALDLASGKLRWHFQFTPHDTHDWDSAHVPLLINGRINGAERKLVAVANRNAFYYVLDRSTGRFISATAYATQTWNDGFEADGRPIIRPQSEPTEQGQLVAPDFNGATVWPSPSYSPQTQLVYVAARDSATVYFKRDTPYVEGTYFMGGTYGSVTYPEHKSAIRALDASTGKMAWEFTLLTPPWAGVLSTAGNLVFSGSSEGLFYALDAQTGKLLWNIHLGGEITANPMAYAIDGHEYLVIAADRVLYAFDLPKTGGNDVTWR